MLFVIILSASMSLSYARILPYQPKPELTLGQLDLQQQAMSQIPTQKACQVSSPSPHPGT